MDNYPYDYPVVTVNLDENTYELVLADLSESGEKEVIENLPKELR